jgi:uncharacterized glyoxalase superfamily protein PhnB
MATRKKTAKKPASKGARPKAKVKAASRPKAKAKAKAKAAAKPKPKARRKPETLRLRDASPGFTVNDLEKSLAFYRDVIGFVEKDRWMNEAKLAGLSLKAGNAELFLMQDDWKKGRDRVKGVGFRIYCTTTQDPDELARQIKARGGTLDDEPSTSPWGRSFGFTDPDGFKITINKEPEKK